MARKKSPTGTWFFKCIRECEFAENVWDRGEVIAVPAGTKVPAKAFKEIERLPYVSASLEMVEDAPMVSLVDGNQDCTSLDTENLQKCLPECVLTAAKGYPTSTEPCFCERILSFYRDRGPKFAFLEPSQCYMVALDNALNESGDSNTKHVYSENLLDALTGWNVKRRIWFELGLLTEYGKWRRKQVGSFEQWLASEAPHLFKSTGRPGERATDQGGSQMIPGEAPAPTQEKANSVKRSKRPGRPKGTGKSFRWTPPLFGFAKQMWCSTDKTVHEIAEALTAEAKKRNPKAPPFSGEAVASKIKREHWKRGKNGSK